MEQFLISIWDYLQSPEFSAILTSILAAYAIIRPFVNKVLSIKSNGKLELAKTKISTITQELEAFKAETEQYKQTAIDLKNLADTLVANANNQSKAMKYAFDRSNLKEDVKTAISKLLPEVTAEVKEVAKPIIEKAKTTITDNVEQVKETVAEVKGTVSNIIRDF